VQARALKMVGIRRALLMITPVNGYLPDHGSALNDQNDRNSAAASARLYWVRVNSLVVRSP